MIVFVPMVGKRFQSHTGLLHSCRRLLNTNMSQIVLTKQHTNITSPHPFFTFRPPPHPPLSSLPLLIRTSPFYPSINSSPPDLLSSLHLPSYSLRPPPPPPPPPPLPTCQLHIPILIQEQVLSLEVPMNDSLLVAVLHS